MVDAADLRIVYEARQARHAWAETRDPRYLTAAQTLEPLTTLEAMLVPSSKIRWRTLPERCPEHGHPLVTYNPSMRRSWCLCGAVNAPGRVPDGPHRACCGGSLTEPYVVTR